MAALRSSVMPVNADTIGFDATNSTSSLQSAFVDPSKADGFLSQLHRRRQEDVSNRAWRQERRADELLHMQATFRERQTARRRNRREIKMRFMMPQVEQDVLNTLHEQTQWRHVMYDNVLSREKHIEKVREQQYQDKGAHLEHMMNEEVAAFEDAKRDDNLRWDALQRNLTERRDAQSLKICAEVITDIVLPIVNQHIDFIEVHKDVLAEEKKPPKIAGDDGMESASPSSTLSGNFSQHPSGEVNPNGPPPFEVPNYLIADSWERQVMAKALREDVGKRLGKEHEMLSLFRSLGTKIDRVTFQQFCSGSPQHEIATHPIHNGLFCALVEHIAKIRFPDPAKLQPKDISPKPVIVVTGPPFSGKTTVAQALANEHGLEYVSDVTLVERALADFEADVAPGDVENPMVLEGLDLGRKARQALLSGTGVSDELLTELLVYRIKNLPEESTGIICDGVPRSVQCFQFLERHLSGLTDAHLAQTSSDKRYNYLAPVTAVENVSMEERQQIVVVERPPSPSADVNATSGLAAPSSPGGGGAIGGASSNPNENSGGKSGALTGSIRTATGQSIGRKKKRGAAEEEEQPLPPVDLPAVPELPHLMEEEQQILETATELEGHDRSVMAFVLYLAADSATLIERHAGLRYDVETGDEYHVSLRPPPLERVPLLAVRDRADIDTTRLHDSIQRYNDEWEAVRGWLSRFQDLAVCQIDCSVEPEQVIDEASSYIHETLQQSKCLFDLMRTARNLRADRAALEAQQQERVAAREQVRKQLAQLYLERQVDPLPAELVDPKRVNSPNNASANKDANGLPITNPDSIPSERRATLPLLTATVFVNLLQDFATHQENLLKGFHQELLGFAGAPCDYHAACNILFNKLWSEKDNRSEFVMTFVKDLNVFQPAIRRDTQGKEELHLRIDALAETLRAVTLKKADAARQYINEVLTSRGAFLDCWADAVRVACTCLLQMEFERFQMVKQLVTLYYAAMRSEPFLLDEATEIETDIISNARTLEPPPPLDEKGRKSKDKNAAALAAAAVANSAAGSSIKTKPGEAPVKLTKAQIIKEQEEAAARAAAEADDPFGAFADRGYAAAKAIVEKLASTGTNASGNAEASENNNASGKKGGALTVGGKPSGPAANTAAGRRAAAAALAAQQAAQQEPEIPSVSQLVVPILTAELAVLRARLNSVVEFGRSLCEEGMRINDLIRSSLQETLKKNTISEIQAVLAAIYHLRCAVEKETNVDESLHLQGATFALEGGASASREEGSEDDEHHHDEAGNNGAAAAEAAAPIHVLSCITDQRFHTMIHLFNSIAPTGSIGLADFARIVSPKDWASSASPTPPSSVESLFSRFDNYDCGYIDWHEFIAHLLLWCEPPTIPMSKNVDSASSASHSGGAHNHHGGGDDEDDDDDNFAAFGGMANQHANPWHIEAPSLINLYESRRGLGAELLDHDTFVTVDLFLQPSHQDDDRMHALREVIWAAFSAPSEDEEAVNDDGTPIYYIDPNKLLLYFCVDDQPLRGIQKAFTVAAPVDDHTSGVDRTMFYTIFHHLAVEPAKMGIDDPAGWTQIEDVFECVVQNREMDAQAAAAELGNGGVGEDDDGGNDVGQPNFSFADNMMSEGFVTFGDVCTVPYGKLLLNNIRIFMRKEFCE